MTFADYYAQYLGLTPKKAGNIFFSSFRDLPINQNYYYPLIKSLYQGQEYYSLSPSLKGELCIPPEIMIKKLLQKNSNLTFRRFLRFTSDVYRAEKYDNIVMVTQEHKSLFMCSGKVQELSRKEQKWESLQNFIKRGHFFAAIQDDKFVASCKISDTYCGGANLVVFTDENYRHRGLGKQLVRHTANYCLQQGLLPIYYVEESNQASINLIKSLCFDLMAMEESLCRK